MTAPDVDTLATYGGAMANSRPVEDPTTDLDAGAWNACAASVAAMTHTAPRAWVRFVGNINAPSFVTSGATDDALWGNAFATRPTLGYVAGGTYTVTWPATITDELGATHTVNLRAARAVIEGASAYHVQCAVTAPNVVTVYTFNMAGTPASLGGTLPIFVQAF